MLILALLYLIKRTTLISTKMICDLNVDIEQSDMSFAITTLNQGDPEIKNLRTLIAISQIKLDY